MAKRVTIGLSLSLTGEYAAMGRQAEAALRLLAADLNASAGVRVGGEFHEVALECVDDASDARRCAEIYRAMVAERRADLLMGPYSSALVRAAAPIAEEARMVLINHGGAADGLYERGWRMIVGVLSPASSYLTGFIRLLATLKFWRKRLAIVAQNSPFASAVAGGAERAAAERVARRRGVRVRVKWNGEFDPATTPANLFPALRRNRVNALLSAGSFAHDVAVIRAIAASQLDIPVLACVAAGVERFGIELGEHAEGIVGPSQWEESAQLKPAIGPAPAAFARRMRAAGAACDYVAAQAFAAGLLAKAALEAAGALDQERIRSAFSNLRTSTLFGDFAIDPATGRQDGHKMLLVQWHRASKVIIEPEPDAGPGTLAMLPGLRLIAAGLEMLRQGRRDEDDERDRD
ncbi:MAG TPA: ABC transporter substrate-binding protein [Candidatus Binataceae bacterium]|nr:ABC transporter substrate-binding protein [Candidatus Binataceae bacterium]